MVRQPRDNSNSGQNATMSSPAPTPQPMSEHTAQRLLTEVISLKGEVILVKAKTEDTHTRLFGNGQPGELATLENKINSHSEWITRADEREKTNRKWTAAISSACGAIIGALAGWVAKHFG